MERQRRRFLHRMAQLAALCAGGPALARAGSAYPFSLGVASGSPLPDSVVLWTRILADPLAVMPPVAYNVRWEVAEDQAFTRIVNKGMAQALPALAHSVHADVKGLAPDRWYWYRFTLGDAVSPVGRTRTAPAAATMPDLLKLAVASCQHWEFGSYGAHRHIANAAPDLVAFLGDYIYEWGPYKLAHPVSAERSNESFTLEEYRARYAQYKSDTDLQAAHLAAPWIVTWDDHEVANDYANDRDERHDPNFRLRRANAYQAFYEHMPIRLAVPPNRTQGDWRMFQRYDWGQLARFHVLDDRQYRSYQACQPAGRGGSSSVKRTECAALRDPHRSMLGSAQEAWFGVGMVSSHARWNIITQQTLMAQMSQLPVNGPDDGRFWTDGWDGYPAARQRLFDALRGSSAANPVVLSGDVHTFFAAELRADFNRPASSDNPVIATEFCGGSVTSTSRPQERTRQIMELNPHIKFGRSDKRGFTLMDITPANITSRFMGMDDVHDARTGASLLGAFQVDDGRAGLIKL